MLTKEDLTPDQTKAVTRLFEYDETFLVAPTGAGKTVVVLTAIAELIDAEEISRVLVIAPLKVCQTAWTLECSKWDHLDRVLLGIATGTPSDRAIPFAYSRAFNVVVINEENVDWMLKTQDLSSFDGLVVDETSKWSDSSGSRFKALRRHVKNFSWRVGVTAQPVGEDWLGLFSQLFLVDGGRSLGKSKDKYRRTHFYSNDYEQRKWNVLPGQHEVIAAKIADLTHVMPDYKHELPELHIKTVPIQLSVATKATYHEMRKKSVLKLRQGTIEAENAAALSGKLEQLANEFIYVNDDDPSNIRQIARLGVQKMRWIRDRTIEILEEGESVIIVQWFEYDLFWLRDLFPGALELGSKFNAGEVIEQWNTEPQVLLLHPANAAHGIDGLQDTGYHQLWVNPVWGGDRFWQTVGRLHRRGQKHEVFIEILIAEGTIDQVKWDVCMGKGEHDVLFQKHLGGK